MRVTRYQFLINEVDNVSNDHCWLWPYGKSKGYGACSTPYGITLAYKAAFLRRYGEVPEGLELAHKCQIRACWNPDHVRPVSHQVNMMEYPHPNKIKLECKNGHTFSDENTVHYRGRRYCRACQHLRSINDKRLVKNRSKE